MHHSPNSAETEINQYLIQKFTTLGVEVYCDDPDNIIAKIRGKIQKSAIANAYRCPQR